MATINDIGIPGVGSGILQPKLKNRWRVTFANLGGGADSQPLSMQAITITRPTLNFEEIQLDRYNSRAWVAGKYTFEPVTLAVEDDVTGTASQVIQEQLQAQQWLIGAEGQWLAAAGEGAAYKFVTYLDLLDGKVHQSALKSGYGSTKSFSKQPCSSIQLRFSPAEIPAKIRRKRPWPETTATTTARAESPGSV